MDRATHRFGRVDAARALLADRRTLETSLGRMLMTFAPREAKRLALLLTNRNGGSRARRCALPLTLSESAGSR
jgi:hypothetical protein